MRLTIELDGMDDLAKLKDCARWLNRCATLLEPGAPPASAPPPAPDILAHPLSDLPLGLRYRNALLRAGITTVGALCALKAHEVLALPRLGKEALREIQQALELRDLRLFEQHHLF